MELFNLAQLGKTQPNKDTMSTTPTPAEALWLVYSRIPGYTIPPFNELSKEGKANAEAMAKAAIDAHLAQVAEGLPTEAEIWKELEDDGFSGTSVEAVRALFTAPFAKLQAERDAALFDKEQAINKQAELLHAEDKLQAERDWQLSMKENFMAHSEAFRIQRNKLEAERGELQQRITNLVYSNEQHRLQAESWRGAAVERDELRQQLAELQQALSGRTVSCSNCNEPSVEVASIASYAEALKIADASADDQMWQKREAERKLEETKRVAVEALTFIQDECDWEFPRGDFGGGGDDRIGVACLNALTKLKGTEQ